MKNNTRFEFDGSNIAQKKLEARKAREVSSTEKKQLGEHFLNS